MSHVVEPLFVEWQRFAACHRSQVMLTHLRNNRVAWQRQQVRPVTSSSQCRRQSLPASRDLASRSRDRRHSAPHTAVLLGALNESPAQSNGQFQCVAESQVRDHVTSAPPPALLHYLASKAERRLSLNNCYTHARRTVMTSRRRSRSLVTPCSHLGNGVASGHLVAPDLTSSTMIRTTGRLRTLHSVSSSKKY